MTATVKVIPRPERTVWVQAYVPEVVRGLIVTSKQFFKNVFTKSDIVTIQYPEVAREYPERFRGLHRLMYREDGQVRCVACMCCSTICPANCIHIEGAEHDDPSIEKYPASFVIDELRCIVCGLCVEACPCDAIRMDSGIHVHPFYERDTSFFDEKQLLDLGGPSIAKQGGRNKGQSTRG